MPELTNRDRIQFRIKLESESNHHGFPLVYQVPFDGQLPLFSLLSFDLTSFDELAVFRPAGFDIERSRSQQLLIAWLGASIEV